ncbi:MAG: S-4TM family putative pore-forming effector [Candidatus Poribacteria bacterium]|nr:S-4TM family putative pore-forming effector [Candidatus Poribacteria bacterium]
MNNIPETQLEPTQLKRLAARRKSDSYAKVILGIQIGLSVLSPPLCSLVVMFFSKFAVWTALYGIIITCLNILWVTPWRQTLKEKAAKIHELFDCDVLELNWRELTVGSRLEMMETVVEYAGKYKTDSPSCSDLKNWYPIASGKLPIHLGRIVCQRTNCWWSSQLRKHYTRIIIFVLVLTVVGSVGIGLIKTEWSLEKWILAVIIPLMPVFILVIQQLIENKKSVMLLDKLKTHAEGLWKKALTETNTGELTYACRELQDGIFNHRRTGPLIFTWLYKRYRKEMERQMNEAADEMVEEALQFLGK